MSTQPRPSRLSSDSLLYRVLQGLLVLGLLAAVIAGGLALRESTVRSGGLGSSLRDRGRVAVLPGSPWLRRQVEGTTFLPATDAVSAALALESLDGDARALAEALDAMDAWGLLVETRPAAEARDVLGRLATYQRTPPLRAVYLTPTEALYTRDLESADALPEGELLAQVARGILEGRSAPPVAMFPEPLRRMRSVEVMVLLRSNGTARLWRSARGSSIARALITACVVARERWHERAQALGGPLDGQLSRLDVEVALLHEDGTLSESDAGFIDRVFTPVHGVAFERTRSWRYYLPDATREHGGGSAVAAYSALLIENGHEPSVLGEAQLRLYRLVVTQLGRSPAPFGSDSPGVDAPSLSAEVAPAPPAVPYLEGGAPDTDAADVDALLPPDEWLPELEDVDVRPPAPRAP